MLNEIYEWIAFLFTYIIYIADVPRNELVQVQVWVGSSREVLGLLLYLLVFL